MTQDQREILNFAHRQGGYFTKAEAVMYFRIRRFIAPNVDAVLGEMVSAGLLEREVKGRYRVGKGKKNKPATIKDGQTELF